VAPARRKGGEGRPGGAPVRGLTPSSAPTCSVAGSCGWDGHGGKFGDYTVTTVVADEGETPQTGVPGGAEGAAERRRRRGGRCGQLRDRARRPGRDAESKKILIVANAARRTSPARRAARTSGAPPSPTPRSPRRWAHTWRSPGSGRRLRHRAGLHGGHRGHRGVHKAFEAGGARWSASQAGPRQDIGLPAVPVRHPELRREGHVLLLLRRRGDHLRPPVRAVRLAEHPLYGSGFLTEGNVLPSRPTRRWACRPRCTTPTSWTTRPTRTSWRSTAPSTASRRAASPCRPGTPANVLNRALRSAPAVDGDTISAALVGWAPSRTARGPWTFEGQTPRQTIYLRRVERTAASWSTGWFRTSASRASPPDMPLWLEANLVSFLNGSRSGSCCSSWRWGCRWSSHDGRAELAHGGAVPRRAYLGASLAGGGPAGRVPGRAGDRGGGRVGRRRGAVR